MSLVTLEQLTKDVNDLPALPMVTLQVIKLTDDTKTSIIELNNCISQDQALVAKILRLANSSYYGFARRISSVTDAIIILGFKTIRNLTFAATVYDFVKQELPSYGLACGELWKQSIVCAMIARNLAIKINFENPEEAFAAGLLHDFGKIILNTYLRDTFIEINNKVNEEKISFSTAESNILGFDHAAIGAKVANKWNLPVALVHAIQYHHSPLEAPEEKVLSSIVHVADALCMSMGIGLGVDGLRYSFDDGVLEQLSLTQGDIEELMSNMADNLVDVTSFIDL